MKNILAKVVLLVVAGSLGLVGCSSNTQSQNATAGTVAGAVIGGLAGSAIGAGAGQVVAIGAGAIVGGLIGHEVGKSMDSSDNMHTNTAMESNPPHKTMMWTNEKTGNVYKITPTSKRMKWHGHKNCRSYRGLVMMKDGAKHKIHGVACRMPNGMWELYNAN